MKKILFVEGIYPINTRTERFIKTLSNYERKYCSWDRNSRASIKEKKENFIFSSKEGYGNKLKKILGIFKYYIFLKKSIESYNPEIIFASQWDMLLLSYFLKKKQVLIYDNIDMPTSNNKLVLKIISFLEKKCLSRVDGVIYASRFFKQCYSMRIPEIIIENMPLKKIYNSKKYEYNSNKIKICFIGTLRYYESFSIVIKCLKKYQESIEFLFFGSGHAEEKLKNLVKQEKIKNIKFFGAYNYVEISKFYNIADYIWAVYPSEDYNVRYAISNKFFESLIFEKPCFFSKNTFLGKLVQDEKIGIAIELNNLDEIFNRILNENQEKIIKNIKKYKEKNNSLFWDDNEENIVDFFKKLEGKKECKL